MCGLFGGIEQTWNQNTPNMGSIGSNVPNFEGSLPGPTPNPNDGTGWFPDTNQPVEAGADFLAGSTDEWTGRATSGPVIGNVLPQQSGAWFPGIDNAVGGVADNVEGATDWSLGGSADAIGNFGDWAGRGLGGSLRGIAQTTGSTVGSLFGSLGRTSGVGDAAGAVGGWMQNMTLIFLLGIGVLAVLVVFV